MTTSVRLNEEDIMLMKTYADVNNLSLSDLIRNAALEKIEDEYDLKAMEEYKENPKAYTLDAVKMELNL